MNDATAIRANGQTGTAKQWRRMGDHPKVRRPSPSEAAFSTSPEKLGWLDGPDRGLIVFPGDWIVEIGNTVLVLSEKEFRKRYEPFAR